MARFTQDTIERVKDSVDIAEVISAYTELRRSGQRLTGLCPFHDERTPSFSVDPGTKLYYCFGCGMGGDAIKFVEEKEGLAFADAVEALADRYGVEIERQDEDPRLEAKRKLQTRLGELLERTAAFYSRYLWESDEAAKAREYLAGRGLGEAILREFGVGYAPSAWDTVLMQGRKATYSPDEMVRSGLAKKGRSGGLYDHFRARIMFPIRDARGRIQGFGGRSLSTEERAKYVNSPEGELYHKSSTLYGIERARPAIVRAERTVVVEGYTDVIAAHQAGFGEVIAVMGTAITPDQVKRLAAYTEEVVLALDADRAGREAMLRVERVAQGKRMRLRVAAMPEGEDPADMLEGAKVGSAAADRFAKLVDDAADLPVFHVRTLLGEADLDSPHGRDSALEEVAPVLASMGDSITRDELVREVGERLGAKPSLVERRVAGGVARPSAQAASAADGEAGVATGALSGRELREHWLLAMCIADPKLGRGFLERLQEEHLTSPLMGRVRDWLLLHLEDPTAGLPRDDEPLVTQVTTLAMRAEREPASPEAMELNFLHLEQAAVEQRLAAARAAGESPPVELQKRRGELSEMIKRESAPARPEKRR